ncbi:MAG: hypothetical protein ABSG97_01270 [Sedimentisphaerales bacterium]|jgi:hypothetical protein
MKSNAAFNHFVNAVFGHDTLTLDETIDNTNNIIGAISQSYEEGQFGEFAMNLKKRFWRLREATKSNPANRKELIKKITNLSTSNWPGYYAELAAYDFFTSFTDVQFEISVPATETLAVHTGEQRQKTSFDGCLTAIEELTFQVKTLKDITKELIDKIRTTALSGTIAEHIIADYPNDIDYNRIESNFGLLVTTLKTAISKNDFLVRLEPQLPEISFKIFYKRQNILTSEHPYSPYCYAQEWETFVLKHFDQLYDARNNLLVYVSHPWINLLHEPFLGRDQFLYVFCRRVFCKLVKETRPVSSLMPKEWPKANIQVSEVVKRIGAILFLFDDNLDPIAPGKYLSPVHPMTAYLYLNPNAQCANQSNRVFDHLINEMHPGMLSVIEGFECDNY